MGSLRQRKHLTLAVSRREYLKVMRALQDGVDPNCEWRSMLPLRLAVMTGDLDMVALLTSAGADPLLEPVATFTRTNEETGEKIEETRTVGKCARQIADDIAGDISNPLHREGKLMLQVMDDKDARQRRMIALQSRLESELASEMRSASRNVVFLGLLAVGAFYCTFYMFEYSDAANDPREL